MEYPSSSGFQSGRDKTHTDIPHPMAPAGEPQHIVWLLTKPHSAGTQKRRERGIKEGFLEEEVREPVLKFQQEPPGCGNKKEYLKQSAQHGQRP